MAKTIDEIMAEARNGLTGEKSVENNIFQKIILVSIIIFR